jgi:hypothetical protein
LTRHPSDLVVHYSMASNFLFASLRCFRHNSFIISALNIFQRPVEVLLWVLQRLGITLGSRRGQIGVDELDEPVDVFGGDLQPYESASFLTRSRKFGLTVSFP